MPGQHRESNCSLGVPIDFSWHDCVDDDGHVDAAIDALWTAVQNPHRRWNP